MLHLDLEGIVWKYSMPALICELLFFTYENYQLSVILFSYPQKFYLNYLQTLIWKHTSWWMSFRIYFKRKKRVVSFYYCFHQNTQVHKYTLVKSTRTPTYANTIWAFLFCLSILLELISNYVYSIIPKSSRNYYFNISENINTFLRLKQTTRNLAQKISF